VNHYGPTETTVGALTFDVGAAAAAPGSATVPLGRPLGNVQTYLLNRYLQPVPAGVVGEVYIGGDGLARGYLNRPELTAERFLPDPFSGVPGARFYRTGDLGRHLSSGDLEFLGRADDQVKIRRYRIEPGEIETALVQHPSVREAAVVAREDLSGGKSLVAYVVGEPAPAAGQLYAFLRSSLPEYMMPSAFVVLDKLPLTPSGKIDRRALPAPDANRPDLTAEFIAPRTSAERVIADVWQTILGLERVGVKDNFFELRGHSLLVTQVIARLRDLFQVEIAVRKLFERPTVEGLAAALAEAWGDADIVEEIARTAIEIEGLSLDEVRSQLSS
jgi:Non-ribosomal peptide synthetase modules and related proteins